MQTKQDRLAMEEEQRMIDRIVNATPWPEYVKGYEVAFGIDHDGDPAVRIWLEIEDDLAPSKEKMKVLGQFRNAIENAVLAEEPTHWPYVNLRALQPAKRKRVR
jgi:hypothetical protein